MEIMPNWEPFSFNNGSDTGILLSHGFTGSSSSVIYLGRKLSEAGFNVEGPRLTGHGTRWEDMIGVRYEQWIEDVENSYKKLKETSRVIFTAGLSMGGTLALRLAEIHPEISGVITINHALYVSSALAPAIPLLKLFIKSVEPIISDLKDETVRETGYERTPVAAVHELMKLQKITRSDIGKIKAPLLFFKSKEDHVLRIKDTVWAYENAAVSDKELKWLDNSYHVATMDYDKDIIVMETVKFIKNHL